MSTDKNDKSFAKLTALRLRDFRAFGELDIKLAPITLLTGANSSGKSSVLSAVASILQTRAGSTFPFDLTPNGVNCSLGGFKDIVHGGNSRSQFGIGVTIEKGEATAELDGTYRYSPVGDHILPAGLAFKSGKTSLEIEWDKQSKKYKARYQSSFLSDSNQTSAMFEAIKAFEEIMAKGEKPTASRTNAQKPNAEEFYRQSIKSAQERQGKWFDLKTKKANELKTEIGDELGTKPIIDLLMVVARDLWSQFTYVGPVRAYPERHYAVVERGNLIDPRGDLSMLELAKWRRSYPRLFRQVVQLLTDLQLADTLRPAASNDDVLRMLVKPKGHKRFINYADTGFGISQILPILIKDVGLRAHGTLLINQPEVHLHPSAQAQLANHFVNRLTNRRYVIETHSEYLINRLRLLVAEGVIEPSDIAIYFFDLNKNGQAKAHPITILPTGNLQGAPKAFFSTYSADAMSLVSAGFNSSV